MNIVLGLIIFIIVILVVIWGASGLTAGGKPYIEEYVKRNAEEYEKAKH